MRPGERQVAPDLSGIRRDHVARYEHVAAALPRGSRVVDFACGVGYGAHILARAGHKVLALDIDPEALSYGRKHYRHRNITWRQADAMKPPRLPAYDAAISFETIEHVEDPGPLLAALRRAAPALFLSVPNEDVIPYRGQLYHFRHYRPGEFAELLRGAGIEPVEWWGQAGPTSEVEKDCMGRTIIAKARRAKVKAKAKAPATLSFAPPPKLPVPNHVVILGLGPSLEAYVDIVKRLGSRHRFANEVWAINALGDVLQCDRVFHMDDVRIQEIRAAAKPESNIAAMLTWLKRHPGPVYTSRPHPDYPGLVAFPLEEVIRSCGIAYFNNTAAYAVAYAVHLGVKEISLFGCDYTYPNAHDAEKGRACLEFHLGIAKARGIEIGLSDRTSLMDSIAPIDERMYGYDTVELDMSGGEGGTRVAMRERPTLPTAAEIERRYDHSKHPNRQVKS